MHFRFFVGETYECIREDKGFRFLSEQVSHHPPVGACYAESPNFTFWQDARVKTKFWGKSMEFQPLGSVHVLMPKTGDHYVWNKVTTCVHNLFSGQRWVDQYGELRITNGIITCKLTFSKASYWSAKRHEVSSLKIFTEVYLIFYNIHRLLVLCMTKQVSQFVGYLASGRSRCTVECLPPPDVYGGRVHFPLTTKDITVLPVLPLN